MKKVMYNYGRQNIDQRDIDLVVKTLQSDWLTQGPKVKEFEGELKKKFGAEHCCAVTNGTAALHLTALALGWQPGDIVITTPLSFLASANCILYVGASPDFVDIDPITYTIDPNKLEDKIKHFREKAKIVKAVVAVDYAGHPCDWEAIRAIADQYELQLVNDNCHALGARYYGDNRYAVKYADVVTQSFHPVKHITTGEGGAVLSNSTEIDQKVRLLRSHGMTKDITLLERYEGPWYYEMVDLGYNYRITDFQCALGISQLRKLDRFVDRRRDIALHYDAAFSEDDRFAVPSSRENVLHAYHLYPLQLKFDEIGLSRKDFFVKMKEKGIHLQVHYIPIHLQPYYKRNYGFNDRGDFSIAEGFYAREVSLPIYYSLSNKDVRFIIDAVKQSIS